MKAIDWDAVRRDLESSEWVMLPGHPNIECRYADLGSLINWVPSEKDDTDPGISEEDYASNTEWWKHECLQALCNGYGLYAARRPGLDTRLMVEEMRERSCRESQGGC